MGNHGSAADNDNWDSSDEGGCSEYEHAYNYHTSVLTKGPADGFESDYEDDFEDHPRRNPQQQVIPASDAGTNKDIAPDTFADKTEKRDRKQTAKEAAGVSVSDLEQRTTKDAAATMTNTGDAQFGSAQSKRQTSQHHIAECENHAHGSVPCGDVTAKNAQQQWNSLPHSTNAEELARATCASASTVQSPVQISSLSQQRNSVSQVTARKSGVTTAEEDDVYETAGEGEKDGDHESVPEDDSISTITPPRQRPVSSESDLSNSVLTDSEDEEVHNEELQEKEEHENDEEDEDSGSESENVHRKFSKKITHVNTYTASSTVPGASKSTSQHRNHVFPSCLLLHDSPTAVTLQEERLLDSHRHARKRPGSPRDVVPPKQNRTSDRVQLSSSKVRYGIFDNASESDTAAPSILPVLSQSLRETRSTAAKTLRKAAKRAASKFVETSKRIIRDAKAAARILKEVASPPKRHAFASEEADATVRHSPESQRSFPEQWSSTQRETRSRGRRIAAEQRRAERLNPPAEPTPSRQGQRSPQTRRVAAKRKAELKESDIETEPYLPHHTQSEGEMEDTRNDWQASAWRQVRKDGGLRRKFTHSRTDAATAAPSGLSAPSQPQRPNIRSNSQPGFITPGSNQRDTSPPAASASRTRSSWSRPSSPPSASNPFRSITLVPTSSCGLNSSKNSSDSISTELGNQGHGLGASLFSPLVILTDVRNATPPPAAIASGSGSVWSRMQQSSARQHSGSIPPSDQQPLLLGQRRATRSSPQTVHSQTTSTPLAKPSTSSQLPTTPNAQFACSGRFAFLLEDVLQVTVASGDLTTATTSAVVITTDSQLQHTNLEAHSVARAAGTGFAAECQNYLRHNSRGLQVCQIVDTPAGGHLCPLISHVLHVVAPEAATTSASDVAAQRKLLLCTYLNCLKHASEKLALTSLGFPLIGSDSYSTDECIQVFFDSLLVYIAERTPTCPLHAVHLIVKTPAVGRFAAEVLEARLGAIASSGIDAAIAAVFRDYFNIPDFSRNTSVVTASERLPSGKPAVKRRRL